MTSPTVVRIVNNVATRALCDGESDGVIDTLMQDIEAQFKPDIIHVHHLQFLSSTMRFQAPTVVTLHDEWAWCAAGGLGLRDGHTVCTGPSPEACAPCHAGWRPGPSTTARWLTKAAGWLSPLIKADRLHRLYQHIPSALRPDPTRGVEAVESPTAAAYRNEHVLGWFKQADALIAPSHHLAARAEQNGLGPVALVRHGLGPAWFEPTSTAAARSGFVSIGTVALHKGTDRVVAGWRSACSSGTPNLTLFGSILDPSAALGHPVHGVLDPAGVRAQLRQARALILGSIWPENAPLIIIEARAAGCPVIAPNIGGIPELVEHRVDGLLFDPNDSEGLSDAIEAFLSSPPMHPTPPPRFDSSVDKIEAIYRRVSGIH
jgi:glycosyltransferase involved in cell wall biosynthesis